MGVHKNINFDKFPKQSDWLGRKVKVCFNYDKSNVKYGKIIRDDTEEPGIMIIQTDDGLAYLSTECQYQLISNK